MAGTERKVLQKYYPPHFDGSKVSRIRTKKSFYFMQRATNLIEQKVSSITDDVKAQEKVDEELLDSLFRNKNESSSTKIVEEVVGEIADSDVSSDDE
uniref:Uncharacterized protein n=1 Tax=Strongyloides venezuelensis TaxID=75913 RepID=A0A0K0G5X1_STRVS